MELKPGKNFGIHSLGRKRTLVLHKCAPADAGTYICRTTDDNTSAKLTVHGNYQACHIVQVPLIRVYLLLLISSILQNNTDTELLVNTLQKGL